jgi:type I restriction enzyme S subunit
MKMGWELKKLGDVLKIERGGSPRPIEKYMTNDSTGINWIKISDATASTKYIYETKEKITKEGLSKTRFVDIDDFILSNSMSFGRPYIMKTTGCIHDGWLVLKQEKSKYFDNDFLYYLLSSPFVYNQFDFLAAGSTVRNLNIALVASVLVPLPPLSEQQRIVSILDRCIEAIDQAKAHAEQNLRNARELFDSYLNAVFQNGGWEKKKLKLLTEVKDGTHDSPKYTNVGIPFVTQKNIKQDGLSFDNIKFITESDHNKFYKRSNVALGDILISMIGANRGMAAIVEDDRVFSIKNVGLIKESKDINSKYLLYYLKSGRAIEYILYKSNGGAQEFIGLTALREFPIPFAPLAEQKSIVHKLDTLRAETQRLEAVYKKKIQDLEELRKSVLEKAFRGELSESRIVTD